MAHVFLSYSSVDRERARRVAEAIEARGYAVWWDRQIAPGQTFDDVIERALDEAKYVVVLWSATSVKSDWVKTEAAEAARRKILVPALLDQVPIPLEFRRVQAANLSHWDGRSDDGEFEKLLQAIGDFRKDSSAANGTREERNVGSGGGAPAAPDGRRIVKWALSAVPAVLAILALVLWLRPGGEVRIPDVTGMGYDSAVAALTVVHIAPERREQPSDTDVAGTVLAQIPAAGAIMRDPATKVILTVAATRKQEGRPPAASSGEASPSLIAANSAGAVPLPKRRPAEPVEALRAEKGKAVADSAAANPPAAVRQDSRPEEKPIKNVADPPQDNPAEVELKDRLENAKQRAEALSGFFERRRITVENSGGHLRPEIQSSLQQVSSAVRTTERSLQSHQTAEASHQLETLEKALQQLEAMK